MRPAAFLTIAVALSAAALAAGADPLPPDATYRPLPTQPFSAVRNADEAAKAEVQRRQAALLEQRYDLGDRPIAGLTMSGGRKTVQGGVRVKLPQGVTWDELARMSPDTIRERNLLPPGFLPLPHVKQATGGQVFPQAQIDEIREQEQRDLRRFDVDFDLPDRFTPEFPPPIFLTTHKELGDVSGGRLVTIRNFYEMTNGIITPVQMEGLRLLLTPFPRRSSTRPRTARWPPTRDPTAKPPPDDMNPQDRLFIQQIALGGMGEIAMAQLAEQRGTSGDVKTFARRMIDDRGKANDRLARLARDLSVPLPAETDAEHQAIGKGLSATKGHGFDRSYLTVQMREHQKAVQLLEWIIGSGQNQAVRDYAVDILPAVMAHLAMVRSLDEKLR